MVMVNIAYTHICILTYYVAKRMLCLCVCECVLRVAGKTHSCVVIESKPKRSDCPKTTEMTETDTQVNAKVWAVAIANLRTGIIRVYLILKNLHYHYPNAFERQVSCEITIILLHFTQQNANYKLQSNFCFPHSKKIVISWATIGLTMH